MLLLCFLLPEQLPKDAQRPSPDLPGSTPSLRDCWRLTEQDWPLVEQSQEELAALTGWKDGLSELRCLALLEAGGMQGVQQPQQSPAGAGKALRREVGVATARARLLWPSLVSGGGSGQNGFVRGNHGTGSCVSLTWSCEGAK